MWSDFGDPRAGFHEAADRASALTAGMAESALPGSWSTSFLVDDDAMYEEQFRERAQEAGYGDFQAKDYGPGHDGPLHTHPFSVRLRVVRGQFTLAFEDGATDYRPGDVCELGAHVLHTERAGSEGASLLLAKRASAPQPGANRAA